MKINAKISIAYDCEKCGERCETETDFPWIDASKIFVCDFCAAKTQIKFVPVAEKEKSDD